MSSTEFKFNTDDFVALEEDMKSLVEKIKTLKETLDDNKTTLLDAWVGSGRNEFEKTYRIIVRTLEDHVESSWDMYENLVSVHQSYIEQDIALAKVTDGTQQIGEK